MLDPPGVHPNAADAGEGGVAHLLVLDVGQGLGRGHRDRVSGVDAHGVEALDRAHDHAVVGPVPLWNYLRAGGKRAFAVWHRRAGKDDVCLHHAAWAAMKRPANYGHCCPSSSGPQAIWTAVNPHTGKRRIDEAFPDALSRAPTTLEMVRFINGSTWAVLGSDTYDTSLGRLVMRDNVFANLRSLIPARGPTPPDARGE